MEEFVIQIVGKPCESVGADASELDGSAFRIDQIRAFNVELAVDRRPGGIDIAVCTGKSLDREENEADNYQGKQRAQAFTGL